MVTLACVRIQTSAMVRRTDIPIAEMEIRVTTDPDRIAASLKRDSEKMTVVFSTYQSMEKPSPRHRRRPASTFDLVLCDEAHRTTGVEHEDGDRSSFLAVHDIDAKKTAVHDGHIQDLPKSRKDKGRTVPTQGRTRWTIRPHSAMSFTGLTFLTPSGKICCLTTR